MKTGIYGRVRDVKYRDVDTQQGPESCTTVYVICCPGEDEYLPKGRFVSGRPMGIEIRLRNECW